MTAVVKEVKRTEESEVTVRLRHQMVDSQIRRRGIRDSFVLEAMLAVPRHLFVPRLPAEQAYDDRPLSIGYGQTISQPYMVAVMTQLIVKNTTTHRKALEIGTGSGYQAAILSLLFEKVFSIERVAKLAEVATQRLRELGYNNVSVIVGDGTLGYPDGAPYDAIVVTAAAPHIPAALKEQLADGGCLVVPVGTRYLQRLDVVTKRQGRFSTRAADGCVFVPLIGRDGWKEE